MLCVNLLGVNQEVTITAIAVSGVTIAQPDVTLMLDMDGIIQGVTLSNDIADEPVDAWRGRPWVETVGELGSFKVGRMVADARASGVSAFRQVNQMFPSGREVPMEYTTVRLGGTAGLIAIGRNLKVVAELQSRLVAAQQAMEQDYWKLREVETRYRQLFDASSEPVLLLNAQSLRVVEANPAAIRALGLGRGREFLPEIAAEEREPFRAALQRVRQHGRSPGRLLHLGPAREAWTVRASQMTGETEAVVLVQLAPAHAVESYQAEFSAPTPPQRNAAPGTLDQLIDRLPDAFVLVEPDGVIRRVNRAFLDLVQVGSSAAVLGERLGRWLSRPGADLAALLANLNRHGAVRLFTTTLQDAFDGQTEVEISAVGHPPMRPTQIALLIRDVGRRLSSGEEAPSLQSALAAIIEQNGKASLRSLVRDATTLVERHYISAALDLVDGNRTAASELLGLSRQGFYKKLAQYDMEGHSKGGLDSVK